MSVVNLDEYILRWSMDYKDPRFRSARIDAENRARTLLKHKLGNFSAVDIAEFARLCNQEYIPSSNTANRPVNNRFSVGFKGQNVILMKSDTTAFNKWSEDICNSPAASLGKILNQFWKEKGIKGGGSLLPTMLLYLMFANGEQKYYPWTIKLAKPLGIVLGKNFGETWNFENYQDYNRSANVLAEQYNLRPHEVDFVLSQIICEGL